MFITSNKVTFIISSYKLSFKVLFFQIVCVLNCENISTDSLQCIPSDWKIIERDCTKLQSVSVPSYEKVSLTHLLCFYFLTIINLGHTVAVKGVCFTLISICSYIEV